MKGGLYIPPNPTRSTTTGSSWSFNEGGALYPPERGAAPGGQATRQASMKGGLYIPPNPR